MKLTRWLPITLVVLAVLTLAACTGMPAQLESVEVNSSPPGETEMEFTGAVDSIGSNAWSIGGLVVGVTASTEIQGDPAVGDLVRVHALVLDGSTLVAREIARAEDALGAEPTAVATPGAGEEIEFFGPAVNIASDSWTVGDQAVQITSATEIKGTISVGDLVKVHAVVQPDLTLTASEIEPATEADMASSLDDSSDTGEVEQEDVELKGIVESIVGNEWTVASVTFLVPAETVIDGTIQVGDSVEVKAFWSTDGVLTAVRIHLEDSSAIGSGSDDGSTDDHSGSDQSDDDGSDSNDDHSGSGSGSSDSSGSGGGSDDSSGGGSD